MKSEEGSRGSRGLPEAVPEGPEGQEERFITEAIVGKRDLPPLFCRVGDLVEFTISTEVRDWEGASTNLVEAGARYEAVALVGWGWDLELRQGDGPRYIRLLNSQMPERVRVVEGRISPERTS